MFHIGYAQWIAATTITTSVQEPVAIIVRRHLCWSITGLEEGLSTGEGDRHSIGTPLWVKLSLAFQNRRRAGHCVGTHPYMEDEFYLVCGKIHPSGACLRTGKLTRGGTGQKWTRHMRSSMPVVGKDSANMGGPSRHIFVYNNFTKLRSQEWSRKLQEQGTHQMW
jgi:hypothetical protein